MVYSNRNLDARKNEEIRSPNVRVISPEGEQLGIMPTSQAIDLAYEKGLDLVEISNNADPPVCKIIDFGKFRFEKEKKAKEAKKNQKQIEMKEVRFSATIGAHDYNFKMKKAKEFLAEGDKVLFRLRFRGREIIHAEHARELFRNIIIEIGEEGIVEKSPYIEGRFLTMILVGKKK